MRLARLSLFGFKSFADKIEIAFEPGITAIVGPNGSGKSNLSDGIRWALGEQSAKLLRGDRMDDLIFCGNNKRKPLGMAEVSLTFTDNYGDIPTEFHEVTVARRLYRSGESEYLLNNDPCRLRDLTDLFLDTGLGGEPYALIEQGSIGNVVNARPHERRLLIEEAAGIMTYKVRKKAALAKLELSEQNLLRLHDIIQEVERQRNSLKRQANKAERYRLYQGRALELKGFVKFHDIQELRRQLGALEESVGTAQGELDSTQGAVAASEADLEGIRIHELQQEQARAASQERLYEIRGRLSRDENDLGHLRQMLDDSFVQQEERRRRLERAESRRAALTEEEAPMRQQEQVLTQDITTGRAQLDVKTSALRMLEQTIAEEVTALEGKRRRLLQDAASLAERRHHLAGLRERERLYGKQRDLANDRRNEIEQQDRDLASLEETQQRFLDRVVEQLTALQSEREDMTQRAVAEEIARDGLKPELDGLREESAHQQSRLASLIELSQSFEGYDDTHRFLLQRRAEGEPRLEGLSGSLAELLEAPARYERAIETLLGDALQGLVMRRAEDAQEALRLLTERGQGRATFVLTRENRSAPGGQAITPLLREAAAAPWHSGSGDAVLEGFAIDLIQFAERDRPLMEALLVDGIVVRELSDALSLSRHLPPPFRIATLAGELITSRGIIAGGPGGGSGILSRRREIAELQERAAGMREHLRTIETTWEVSLRRSSQLTESLDSLNQRIHEVDIDRLKADRELFHTGGERRRLRQQIEVLLYEAKSHEEDLRLLAQEIQGLESDLVDIEARYAISQSEMARLETEATARQQERDALIRDVGEARVHLTALQGQREILARGLLRIEEEMGQLNAELEALGGELNREEVRRSQMEASVRELQERLTGLVEEERLAQQHAAEQDEARRELARQREVEEERLRALKHSLAQAHEALNAAALQRAELRNTISILERTVVEEGLGEVEAIAARLSESGLGVDGARSELGELNAKISELGGVNLAALEEYQELVERHRFLTTQAEDLQSSARSLRAAIAEINTTIQQRFSETLETVNGHLDRLWKCLIPDGQAQLSLLEPAPEDEEPGLDMVVRIPGKRATLNLLSGGEKALAALALLLALFHTRPSPFCLLDEVDAPLDDANAERFACLLKEMAASAQFILITHNKRTMEVADILYGVTMEETGVSRLLSLRMSKAA